MIAGEAPGGSAAHLWQRSRALQTECAKMSFDEWVRDCPKSEATLDRRRIIGLAFSGKVPGTAGNGYPPGDPVNSYAGAIHETDASPGGDLVGSLSNVGQPEPTVFAAVQPGQHDARQSDPAFAIGYFEADLIIELSVVSVPCRGGYPLYP